MPTGSSGCPETPHAITLWGKSLVDETDPGFTGVYPRVLADIPPLLDSLARAASAANAARVG